MSTIKLIQEKHNYAPELNKIHFFKNGVKLASINATSLTQYRNKNKLQNKVVRYIEIEFYYDDPKYTHLNRVIKGTATYKYIKDYINHELSKNMGSTLLNGDYLPPLKYKIRTLQLKQI